MKPIADFQKYFTGIPLYRGWKMASKNLGYLGFKNLENLKSPNFSF